MKDRDLSIPDFLNILQKEYFLAMLRKKIYPSIKQKNYYSKLMEYKEEKIRDLSTKFSLRCIFEDDVIFNEFKEIVFGNGHPNFFYRNEQDRNNLEFSDEVNYYSKGAKVRVLLESETLLGEILRYNILEKTIKIQVDGRPAEWYDSKKISRVL